MAGTCHRHRSLGDARRIEGVGTSVSEPVHTCAERTPAGGRAPALNFSLDTVTRIGYKKAFFRDPHRADGRGRAPRRHPRQHGRPGAASIARAIDGRRHGAAKAQNAAATAACGKHCFRIVVNRHGPAAEPRALPAVGATPNGRQAAVQTLIFSSATTRCTAGRASMRSLSAV
jgi:hypothetical protein